MADKLPPRAFEGDDREWVETKDGWVTVEYLERLAICLESGLPMAEAKKIAHEQDDKYGTWTPGKR